MCNLYKLDASNHQLGLAFDAEVRPGNAGAEVYPGTPGMVVREEDGRRIAQSMVWGFPLRLKGMKPDAKPRPVNNIADLNKPMWKGLAARPQWRCLIPLTAFAEAEGVKGRMTRTWFGIRDRELFAWAGLWRESAEWGPVYSGVMTDCNDAIRPVHDRMPVLLHADEHHPWLNGNFDDAVAFQNRCFPSDVITIERTAELWVKRKPPTPPPGESTLFD